MIIENYKLDESLLPSETKVTNFKDNFMIGTISYTSEAEVANQKTKIRVCRSSWKLDNSRHKD